MCRIVSIVMLNTSYKTYFAGNIIGGNLLRCIHSLCLDLWNRSTIIPSLRKIQCTESWIPEKRINEWMCLAFTLFSNLRICFWGGRQYLFYLHNIQISLHVNISFNESYTYTYYDHFLYLQTTANANYFGT